MSAAYGLICRETRQCVWIGQGPHRATMTTLYNGEKHAMNALKAFLNATKGKPLEFAELYDLNDYEEFEHEQNDSQVKR